MSKILRIAAGVLVGASLLTLVGPVVGEAVASRPPYYPKTEPSPIAGLGIAYEDVAFATGDGLTLRGWFVPAEAEDAPAVLYAPATHNDQRSGLSLVPSFHQAGYHVLLFSYRGHAESDGAWGQFTYGKAESQDVDAAVRFLVERKGISRIAVIGYSAGAVSAILSAARNPHVGAVVAVAPFTCMDEVWHTSRPALVPAFVLDWTLWLTGKLRGFSHEQVCPVNVVGQIAPRPILVIHGTADRRITQEQVERLFAAAQTPKALWLVPDATHSSIRAPVLDTLAPDVIAFLNQALSGQGDRIASVQAPGSAGLRQGSDPMVSRTGPEGPERLLPSWAHRPG